MPPKATCSGLIAFLVALPASAQNLVLDEGTFAVTIDGGTTGTEEFAIRQAGLGSDATLIANGTVSLAGPRGEGPMQVLLSADPTDGSGRRYQVEVGGAEPMDLRLYLSGRRYVSVMRSPEGEEEREFPGRPETRFLEAGVAHHYYFLRGLDEGASVPVIEPRTRRRLELRATSATDEEIHLSRGTVSARRVVLEADADRRIVWFDRQGRVLRVEVPAAGYVAERTDLVG